MLTRIAVENVALIEKAALEFSAGLNVISGETGAGKTLLATALRLLLGGRARPDIVRSGAGRATIEGNFLVSSAVIMALLADALGDLAQELELDDELVLRRTLTEDGRSRCYVNGLGVPVKTLALLGESLVSYHGQREQTRLTEPGEQLKILDDFLSPASVQARDEHIQLWAEVERDRTELKDLRRSAEARTREIEFLKYQLAELDAAGYTAGEAAILVRERDKLRNVTELLQSAVAAAAALSGDEAGAVEFVGLARSELERAVKFDSELHSLSGRLESVAAELEDVVYELRAYLDELDADPGRLEEVEDRLAALKQIERKYGQDVEGYTKEARSRLTRLENFEVETAELETRISRGEERLRELEEVITEGRRHAAIKLSNRVMDNLAGLNLKRTVFGVRLLPVEPGPLGRERVEFVIQPNPGEPELEVRRYASGGELSRIMLAIRLAQERVEPGATYIFDEVDAGIGGETATAVGEKLSDLGRRNQVLAITHLPQIASRAQAHVVVEKAEDGGRTITQVRCVTGEDRRRELARMLSGRVDEASLAHASELMISDR